MSLIVVAEERDEEGNLIDIRVKCAGCGYNHGMQSYNKSFLRIHNIVKDKLKKLSR
jgi:hypothetical protein